MNIRTKRVKRALGIVGLLSFIISIGSIGAVELDRVTLLTGFIRAIMGILTMGMCVILNNQIDTWLEESKVKVRV